MLYNDNREQGGVKKQVILVIVVISFLAAIALNRKNGGWGRYTYVRNHVLASFVVIVAAVAVNWFIGFFEK